MLKWVRRERRFGTATRSGVSKRSDDGSYHIHVLYSGSIDNFQIFVGDTATMHMNPDLIRFSLLISRRSAIGLGSIRSRFEKVC
jgi:hypothetical protein